MTSSDTRTNLPLAEEKALEYLKQACLEAGKIPGLAASTKTRLIREVGIIGAGTMGGGIAMNFANAGIRVKLLEIREEALEQGLETVRRNYAISAGKGKLTQAQVELNLSFIEGTLSYDDLATCDLVIEAVFEKIGVKKAVFEKLDTVCKPGAILATNSSYLNVDEIAAVTDRPQDVIGLHFFSPANIMRLLEIVRASHTSDEVLLTTLEIAQTIGKTAVVSGICWGFIGNRIFEPYGREACRLLLEGATPRQIDQALTDFGFAMGFLSVIDLAGIDIGYHAREGIRDRLQNDPSYQAIGDKLYELGRYGQKTGRGIYLYQGRERIDDPEVPALCKQIADELGILQGPVSDQEIIERTLFSMINEAALILEEGIAYRPGDIDVVVTHGYGFPKTRGGLMHYANQIGLDTVLEGILKYQKALGAYGELWFKPAPLLEKLVTAGDSF